MKNNLSKLLEKGNDFKGILLLSPKRWLLIFIAVYGCLIGFSVVAKLHGGFGIFSGNSGLGEILLYPGVLFFISLAALKRIGIDFKITLCDWAANLKSDALLGAVYFAAYLLVLWLLHVAGLGRFMEDARDAELYAAVGGNTALLCAVVFSAVVLAPVGEEIFFKRLLYAGLRYEMPALKAILLCSLLFALLHPGAAFLSIVVFAPFTYYMYEKHRRLLANIILHSLINLTAIWDKFF